ncbi:unnamed protein product [Aphanomyces euteiches]
MEINIDPQKLQHPKKKLEFFLKRDAVLQGVGKTANELRRRLFNRQEKRKTDYARLPMVQEAKKDMFDIRMDLVQQDVKSRIIETHTRTQFEMEETFRYLTKNIHESSRNIRDKASTLDDLTRRVEFLQSVNSTSDWVPRDDCARLIN